MTNWPRCECGAQLTTDGNCTMGAINHSTPQLEVDDRKYLEKKLKTMRKCKGHKPIKGAVYDSDGRCSICGGINETT